MVSTAKQWKNWGIKRWTWLSNWPEHNLHFEGFLSNVISNPPLENLPFIGFGPTWPFFIRTNESFVAFFATIKRCLRQMNESSSSRVLISMWFNWHRLTFKKWSTFTLKTCYRGNTLPGTSEGILINANCRHQIVLTQCWIFYQKCPIKGNFETLSDLQNWWRMFYHTVARLSSKNQWFFWMGITCFTKRVRCACKLQVVTFSLFRQLHISCTRRYGFC